MTRPSGPNAALRDARRARGWTQHETAEHVLEWLAAHSLPAPAAFDQKAVSRLERGVIRWPHEDVRAALRAVFEAATDTELGLSRRRHSAPSKLRTPAI